MFFKKLLTRERLFNSSRVWLFSVCLKNYDIQMKDIQMNDQLYFTVFTPRIEVFGGGKWQNGSSSNITQNREFVWIG